MNNPISALLRILTVFVFSIFCVTFAGAQATRTWISGVGDDANPCSRTAPCKTFQGTISKTASNGEMNVLDPGGFGPVTITKSMTIDGGNFIAGVLVSGTNGIIINAAGFSVTLRGLDINGLNTGSSGIKILNADAVFVENCQIYGFSRGISDERTTGGELSVTNTIIKNNSETNAFIGSSPTILKIIFDNVQFKSGGQYGIWITSGRVVVRNSVISANLDAGMLIEGTSQVEIDNTNFSQNMFGISTSSGTPAVRVGNSTITMNKFGLSIGAGTIDSYGNNKIVGNTSGSDTPSSTIALQ